MKLGHVTRRLLVEGRKALVPFFTAGYPDEATFLDCLAAAAAAGCPLVEVGVPFSDPLADGPAIQESSRVALAGGMTLRRALDLCAASDVARTCPIVLMSYVNPILRLGPAEFAARARAAGVRGAILPDVPHEESAELRAVLAGGGIALVDMIAPTSGPERIRAVVKDAQGFLYLVALNGVTGARRSLDEGLAPFVRRVLRETDLPLYVGFGISSPAHAAGVASLADGAIVGSALVEILRAAPDRRAAVAGVERFLTVANAAMNREQAWSARA